MHVQVFAEVKGLGYGHVHELDSVPPACPVLHCADIAVQGTNAQSLAVDVRESRQAAHFVEHATALQVRRHCGDVDRLVLLIHGKQADIKLPVALPEEIVRQNLCPHFGYSLVRAAHHGAKQVLLRLHVGKVPIICQCASPLTR